MKTLYGIRPKLDPDRLRFPDGRIRPGKAAVRAGEDALAALDQASRKIRDLARDLNCFGYFEDDDDDRPRAA